MRLIDADALKARLCDIYGGRGNGKMFFSTIAIVFCKIIDSQPTASPEYVETESNLFDVEEIHDNCTVQILRNSVTGEESVGWWPNRREGG